jgi:hypothetical protein
MVGLYADVHVPGPVIVQLRRRGVDIITAIEEHTNRLPDGALLKVSTALSRIVVTQDIRFRVMAEKWQRDGIPFAGLVFGHQQQVTYGQMISDLELIAKATDPEYWQNRIQKLPL